MSDRTICPWCKKEGRADLPHCDWCLKNFPECDHCKEGRVKFVRGYEPWSTDHYACELCNSTYNEKSERDQWRECADKLAEALFYELSGTMTLGGLAHGALAEFYRLKEKNK